MKKNKFRKCYGCFLKYSDCKKQRLPRKKKKQYKKYLEITKNYLYRHFMEIPDNCNLSDWYKNDKDTFKIIPIIKKYKIELDLIFNRQQGIEDAFFDNRGKLCWYWEEDNDYGGSSGLMPFCYNQIEAGNTWAFSELKIMLMYILDIELHYEDWVFPKEITSDLTLLKYIRKHKK